MAARIDQKDRIRRTAARLWARQGYHATGIQELSQAVGLGRAAIYHHIGSKEELLFEISTRYVGELVEQAEGILAEPSTPAPAKLRRLSRGLVRNIADNLPEWTVFFHEAGTLTGGYREQMVAHRTRYERLWAAVVDEGVASGAFRPVDAVMLKGLLGMHNYSYLWLRRDDRLSAEEIADEFTALMLRGMSSDEHLSRMMIGGAASAPAHA